MSFPSSLLCTGNDLLEKKGVGLFVGKCIFLDHFILKIMSPGFFWLPCLFVSVVLCLLMVIHVGPHSFLSVNLLISLSKEAVSQGMVSEGSRHKSRIFALCSLHVLPTTAFSCILSLLR